MNSEMWIETMHTAPLCTLENHGTDPPRYCAKAHVGQDGDSRQRA